MTREHGVDHRQIKPVRNITVRINKSWVLEVPPLSHKCALTAVRNQPVHAELNHDDDGNDDNVSNLSKEPAMLEIQTDHDRRKFTLWR